MIYIKDNFLEPDLLETILKDKREYLEVETPGKSFWVKEPSNIFVDYMVAKISYMEHVEAENILCFFRQAKLDKDNEWRVHNDSIIEGQKPERALVLFLSEDNHKGLNGTALWSHKTHGDTYKGSTEDDFNKLLINDSNDISKWDLKTVIGHKQNRLVSYPCEYFHSKYPNAFEDSREVLVMFYKTKISNEERTIRSFRKKHVEIQLNERKRNERIEANRNEKQGGCGCKGNTTPS
tara:strand:- start:339 stop:1046 length:708 start_codon:yes stop_codon:yes gene_type:complete